MFGNLFGKRKRAGTRDSRSVSDSIGDGQLGDVFTVTGLSIEYEDSYFIIEKLNRYEGYSGTYSEFLGVDVNKKLWVQSSVKGQNYVTVTVDGRSLGLSKLNVSEEDIVRIDEEHSIENYVTYEGKRYHYRNSGEMIYYENNGESGIGFYTWEFTEEDGMIPSIVKWEGLPFEVYISQVVSAEDVVLYKH